MSLHPIVAAKVAITSKQFQFPPPCLHPFFIKKPNLSDHAGDLAWKISLGFVLSSIQVRLGKLWDLWGGKENNCVMVQSLFLATQNGWTSLPCPAKHWTARFSLLNIYGIPCMCWGTSKHGTNFTENGAKFKLQAAKSRRSETTPKVCFYR